MRIYLQAPATHRGTGYGAMSFKFREALGAAGAEFTENPKPDDLQLHIGLPESTYRSRAQRERRCDRVVFYTMFEASPPPPDWVANLNADADAMITPSEWARRNFMGAGLQIPCAVVRHGVDQRDFHQVARDHRDAPVFLWVGDDYNGRKGAALVERAFREVVREHPGARLILKWMPVHCPRWHSMEGPIEYIGESFTTTELLDLFRRADCFVWPTAGEGFGLPPLEAAATGLPVIVTAGTGCDEYLEDIGAMAIRSTERKTAWANRYGAGQATDRHPDFDHLKALMTAVAERLPEARMEGCRSANRVREAWGWDRAAREFFTAMEGFERLWAGEEQHVAAR